MFSDHDTGLVGFPSNYNFSRTSEDRCVQTSELVSSDKDVQTVENHQQGVQTEDGGTQSVSAVVYDEDKFAAFLGRICPEVVKELDRASRSNAFSSYSLAADTEEEARVVTTLVPRCGDGVKVSELSWSCTGSVLAVALSHTLHSSWCAHQGHIALYNVDRESKAASRTLDAPSCIRTVSMHPYLSSIVAAGTFSGEVLLWDLAVEGLESALINVTHTSHNDSVSQVCWVVGTGTAVTLVSSGLDGHLIFWKVSPKLSSYQMIERYSCDPSSAKPGVTCFAFPLHKQDPFIVAVEGGALLHCSATAAKPVASVHSSEAVKDPVISSFEPQSATVTCVQFSPFHDDVLATVSTDQAIRIYSLFQRCAQSVIWGSGALVGLAWSLAQANVLAAWGDGVSVTLYNSLSGDMLTSFLPEDSSERKAHLSAIAFNAKSPKLLAVGDLDGVAHVWNVPTHLSTKPTHL